VTSERNLSKLNALLVDDDPECREFLASVLESEAKSVVQAGDAESAIDTLKRQVFDVVVTDKNLPQMDGISLIKFIRENYVSLPVILITGQGSVGSAVDAFKLGADDYLLKPLEDPEVLLRTVWRVVEQRRLEKENRMLQQKLLRAEKMESLGMLAAGVAHEINNPTGFIIGNLDLLKEDIKAVLELFNDLEDIFGELGSDDAAKRAGAMKRLTGTRGSPVLKQLRKESVQMIEDALDGAQRIKRIVGSLRGFARVDTETVELIDLNEEVERSLTLVWNDLKYKCEVTKDFQQLPRVMGNPSQIDQVLVNILINAGQAIEGKKGLITIRTYSGHGQVNVEIRDNGKGISDEHMEHIFDPFFTTKDVGVGTGLGLYIAYGIMRYHNGSIDVRSKVGEGTTCILTFPEGAANA